MHRNTPSLLRITMRTAYDPTADDEQTARRVDEDIRRIADIASRFEDELQWYEVLEVHFYLPAREQTIRQATFTRPVTGGRMPANPR